MRNLIIFLVLLITSGISIISGYKLHALSFEKTVQDLSESSSWPRLWAIAYTKDYDPVYYVGNWPNGHLDIPSCNEAREIIEDNHQRVLEEETDSEAIEFLEGMTFECKMILENEAIYIINRVRELNQSLNDRDGEED